jgi:hypothetical protein
MENFEKWRFFTKNLPSPDSWIDFGWYFLIGACLQRRVWLYDDGIMPLYANQYVVFVGPPGLGKGIVLGPLAQFLKYHKYEKGQLIKTSIGQELPPLYPVGADSITFEQLLADVGDSSRRIPTPENKVYMHCSYAFVLEELASLFKHKTSDVIKFLQNAYDCKDYEYKTKHQGKDILRNICFSFIAGTQVDFLKEASESRIFGQGFASRTLFLFESQERFSAFHIAEFSEEQLAARKALLLWIKQLSSLYGQVTYDKDVYKFLEEWYQEVFVKERARASHKMLDYFSRKKVIMLKLAMAIHFSENLTLNIPLAPFKLAIKMLGTVEAKMAAGLSLGGKNELHSWSMRIKAFIQQAVKPVTKREILMEFLADLEMDQIEGCLLELENTHGLKRRTNDGSYYFNA